VALVLLLVVKILALALALALVLVLVLVLALIFGARSPVERRSSIGLSNALRPHLVGLVSGTIGTIGGAITQICALPHATSEAAAAAPAAAAPAAAAPTAAPAAAAAGSRAFPLQLTPTLDAALFTASTGQLDSQGHSSGHIGSV
jgi:hypothetical protein